MKADKKPPADDWSNRLRESLRKSRPRTLPIVLATFIAAAALVALVIWWLYPRPPQPRLLVVAFDQIGVPGEKVSLSGALQAPPGEERGVRLNDLEVIFEEGGLQKPGERPKQAAVRSGPGGLATCPWTFPDDFREGDFIVRTVGTREAPGTDDRGRAYLWPRDSRLALVQVNQALTSAADQDWSEKNVLDIPPMPGAADALSALKSSGFHMAYLAIEADQPLQYQKMRGWVRLQSGGGQGSFPWGPVFSRFGVDGDANDPWQRLGSELKEKYAGPHVAIAATPDAAEQLRGAGFMVYFLGKNDVAPDMRRAATWAELRRLIETELKSK